MLGFRPDNPERWRIAVIDGPNMSNLGHRSKVTYGTIASIHDLQQSVKNCGDELGVEITPFVSNYEGEILEFIHASAESHHGFIINPAGLTTYGEATRHALDETCKPVIECHFANTARHFDHAVQAYQNQFSRFTYSATGLVMGMRQYSYVAALFGLVLSLDDTHFLDGGKYSHHER